MSRTMFSLVLAIAAIACPWSLPDAAACPFCAAQSQTFSEEMASMDVVVLARLVELPPPLKPGAGNEVTKARFELARTLKGESLVGNRRQIESIYFGDGEKGQAFLIMGVDPPKLMWSTPLALTPRAEKYIMQLAKLPAEGADRLVFFQQFLEDKEELLARDAYDEFARAPYNIVVKLKDKMNHDQLLAWIQSDEIPASRRRLYLTMLGVCGTSSDLPALEAMLKSSDRKQKSGLDAMIACYLTLKGPDGMDLVEDLFLKNHKAEYADTYAAIMALRFHGTETTVVPQERILGGLRHMLDRPKLADLVIPDLARWEDWSVVERLVQLFKDADMESSWVRVPVINYLRACPLPKAKDYIDELEKIDPDAVKRANTFFPFTPATGSNDAGQRPIAASAQLVPVLVKAPAAATVTNLVPAITEKAPVASNELVFAAPRHDQPDAAVAGPSAPASPSRFVWIVGGPLIAGAVLTVVMLSILCGGKNPSTRRSR